MTPSHDGSMTPRGSWDPQNTPARPTDFEYLEDASPTPGYPMTTFTPQTPGNFQCNFRLFSIFIVCIIEKCGCSYVLCSVFTFH